MKIKFYQKTFDENLYWELPRKKVLESINYDIMAFCILKRDGYLKTQKYEYKSKVIK